MNSRGLMVFTRASGSRSAMVALPAPSHRHFIRSLQTTSRRSAGAPDPSAYAKRMQNLMNQPNRNRSANPLVPLQQPWPWHEVPSSSPDTVTLQRTLFARPPDFAPPLLLFAAGVWGLFVFAWLLLPDPPRKEYTDEEKKIIEENERKAKEANMLSRLGMSFTNTIFTSAQPLIYGLVTIGLITMMASSTRIVTRINMLQIKPKDGSSQSAKTVLRLTNVGHEMLPWRANKSREVKVEDCQVYIPNLNNSHTIRLKVLKNGQVNKWSLDRFPYSLDYRAIPGTAKVDKEVVQSVNRLQHVFGYLKVGQ
ncbi:hypothetical protein L486_07356 [Kwoniella mangroviensis CBS 10435]|uniref:Uncharacterized protein n=1 Tax=Kwoniella mangroviensis CBS 10435 TaxID=1331196 RepID=A0A1B9IID0_9TREE|nr:hypothetical protein L486_07356 [Kwoniella mangroviensis CBS 10435]